MQRGKAIFGGVIGALAITRVTAAARAAGVPINLELMLGTMLGGSAGFGFGMTVAWIVGFVIHLIAGGVFGLIYAAGFEYLTKRASMGIGLLFGAAHAFLAGMMLGLMPQLHPLMPGSMAAPGIFMANYGMVGFMLFGLVHMMFGILVAYFYAPVTRPHRRGSRASHA